MCQNTPPPQKKKKKKQQHRGLPLCCQFNAGVAVLTNLKRPSFQVTSPFCLGQSASHLAEAGVDTDARRGTCRKLSEAGRLSSSVAESVF